MILVQLLLSFINVGSFSIGGGYAILPLIERQVVHTHGWLSATEFADIVTLSQLTPGPVALNCASFVGARLAGIAGSITATVGCILPACIVMSILAVLYSKLHNHPLWAGALSGLRSATVGMIAAAGLSLFVKVITADGVILIEALGVKIDPLAVVLFGLALLLLRKKKLGTLTVMLLCGAAGGVGYIVTGLLGL